MQMMMKTLFFFALFFTFSLWAMDGELKVLVWNVHKAADGKKWEEDYKKLIKDHDIVLIQEALVGAAPDSFLKTLPVQHEMAVSFYKKDQSATGVATGAKIESVSREARLSPDREPILKTPKASLFTTYALEGEKESLLVVNTHAINFVTNEKFENQMKDLASIIKKHKGPVIWAGDFNTWSKARMTILNRVSADLGMVPVRYSEEKRSEFIFGHQLDHVFVKGLSVKKAEALDQIESSDHRPISVTLVLDPQYAAHYLEAYGESPYVSEPYFRKTLRDWSEMVRELDQSFGIVPENPCSKK